MANRKTAMQVRGGVGQAAQVSQPFPSRPGHRQLPRLYLLGYYLLGVLGGLVFLSPALTNLVSNLIQQQENQELVTQLAQRSDTQLREQIREALAYNRNLSIGKPVLDPWLSRLYQNTSEYRHYLQLLNLGPDHQMGIVRVKKIGLEAPIFHGTEPQTLNRGVGHLFGTSLPVGGPGSHSVLTGHSGLGTVTIFDRIVELKSGDEIEIELGQVTLHYRVSGTKVISPNDTSSLAIEPQADRLTLITCYPYRINTYRYLVFALRVKTENGTEPADSTTSGQTDSGAKGIDKSGAGVPRVGRPTVDTGSNPTRGTPAMLGVSDRTVISQFLWEFRGAYRALDWRKKVSLPIGAALIVLLLAFPRLTPGFRRREPSG